MCGDWDFESGVEGWAKFNTASTYAAWGGNVTVSKAQSKTGLVSLALPFDNKGGFAVSQTNIVEVSVPLCPGTKVPSLDGTASVSWYLAPASGVAPLTSESDVQVQLDVRTGNGDIQMGPIRNTKSTKVWETISGTVPKSGDKLYFSMSIGPSWRGTVYIDAASVQ